MFLDTTTTKIRLTLITCTVVNGAVVQAYTFEYRKKLDETREELLSLGIVEMRQRFGSESKRNHRPFSAPISRSQM